MIQVIFKSLCINEAYKRTKKILDKFAVRTADKTWETFTTYKYLDLLIKKLKKEASKNTSINIFIYHKKGPKLYTIIGKKLLNDNYGIPISYSQINKNYIFKENEQTYKNIKNLLEFTTKLHDIGKNNNVFQNKLRKNIKQRDTIRHDFLSVFYLYQILIKEKSLITFYKDNKNIKLEEINQFLNFYFDTLENIIYNSNFITELNFINENKKKIIFFLIINIILYHHKFFDKLYNNYIDLNINEKKEILKEFIYLFFNKENITDINININYNYDEEKTIYDIQVNLKKSKKIKLLKEFGEILETNIFYNIHQEFTNLINDIQINFNTFNIYFYLVRSFLMFIDHNISQLKLIKDIKQEDLKNSNWLLANLKQLLGDHLLKEKEAVNEFLELMQNKLNTLQIQEKNTTCSHKFEWQTKAINKINNLKKGNKIKFNGSFIVLNAETGTGKTIMTIKLLKELTNNNIRANYLYNLRLLSKQTFESIKNYGNISDKNIALIIGEKEIKNDEKDYDQENIIENIISYKENYKYIEQELRTKKLMDLIKTPLVVATIDYFTNIHKINKTKYLISLFRLMQSDIVIDEIDQFIDKKQLMILQHLIYINGFFKRNVIISSATIHMDLVQLFYNVYKKGYEDSNLFYNKEDNFIFGIVNNFKQDIILNSLNTEKIIKNNFEYKINILKEKKHNLKKTKYIEQKDIINTIFNLHKKNHFQLNKKNVSFGFVKFFSIDDLLTFFINNVKNIKKEGYKIKFQLLHSQLGLEYRNIIENKLNEYLYRGNNKYKNFFEEDLKNIKEKNIIYVLFTTPIIEVGKDWDFDWGITQYQNIISTIQTAGRIYRHRIIKTEKECLAIFLNNNQNTKDYKYIKNENLLNNISLNSKSIIDKKLLYWNIEEYSEILKNTRLIKIGMEIDTKLNFREKNKNIDFVLNNQNGKIINSIDYTLEDFKFNKININTKLDFIINNNLEKDKYVINKYKKLDKQNFHSNLGIFTIK